MAKSPFHLLALLSLTISITVAGNPDDSFWQRLQPNPHSSMHTSPDYFLKKKEGNMLTNKGNLYDAGTIDLLGGMFGKDDGLLVGFDSNYFFGVVAGEFPFFSPLLYRNVARDFKL